jgi:hypothetical protein
MFTQLSSFSSSVTREFHPGDFMTTYYSQINPDLIVSITTFSEIPDLFVPSLNTSTYNPENTTGDETCWDSTLVTYTETRDLSSALNFANRFSN